MDMRRRIPKPPVKSAGSYDDLRRTVTSPPPKASDALPLPLYLTNAVFFTLFFSVAYYLLQRWRDKICYSTPLHVVTIAELGAIISLIASLIYFLGFFGVDFVQSFISRADSDDFDSDFLLTRSPPPPPQQILSVAKSPNPEPVVTESLHEEDEEIVKSVIDGSL